MPTRIFDTDVLSYYLKGNKKIIRYFQKYWTKEPFLTFSIITFYEIYRGLLAIKAMGKLKRFLELIKDNKTRVILIDMKSGEVAAKIYAGLRSKGQLIPDADIISAAIAMANNLTFVTNNEEHFGRIEGLKLEIWKP